MIKEWNAWRSFQEPCAREKKFGTNGVPVCNSNVDNNYDFIIEGVVEEQSDEKWKI